MDELGGKRCLFFEKSPPIFQAWLKQTLTKRNVESSLKMLVAFPSLVPALSEPLFWNRPTYSS